jgi:hypothetical protein
MTWLAKDPGTWGAGQLVSLSACQLVSLSVVSLSVVSLSVVSWSVVSWSACQLVSGQLVSGANLLFTFYVALPASCEDALPLGWRSMALKFFEIL